MPPIGLNWPTILAFVWLIIGLVCVFVGIKRNDDGYVVPGVIALLIWTVIIMIAIAKGP